MSSPVQGEKATIVVSLLRGDRVIRAFDVQRDIFTIGSGRDCAIRAAGDESILEKHATIYLEDGELSLVPEKGAKVLVDGEAVDFAVLKPESVVKAGRLTFRVDLKGSAQQDENVQKNQVDIAKIGPTGTSRDCPPSPTDGRPGQEGLVGSPEKDGKPWSARAPSPPEDTAGQHRPADTNAEIREKSDAQISTEAFQGGPVAKASSEAPLESAEAEASNEELHEGPERDAPSPSVDEADVDLEWHLDAEAYFDEGEDDELSFEAPFDLGEALLSAKEADAQGPRESYCSGHFLRVMEGRVVESATIQPESRFSSRNREVEAWLEGSALIADVAIELNGHIWNGEERLELDKLAPVDGKRRLRLDEGAWATFRGARGQYKLELRRPPRVPRAGGFQARPQFFGAVVLALLVHLAFGIFRVAPEVKEDTETAGEEVFAMVKVDEPKKKVKPPPKPPDATHMAEKAVDMSARAITRRVKEIETRPPGRDVDSLLKVLSKGSGTPGASDSLRDLVSNIDAVPDKGGKGSAFSIAGAIGALPGNEVNIAKKGGGGIVSTLSGDQVAGRGSGIGRLGSGRKRGKVRGKVTKMSSSAKIQGSLSRAEVTKVVNAHIQQIQACYEKELMSDPSLSGRIVFDWTVELEGSVSGVRVRSSTLGSAKVATCISTLIRGWTFPHPKGAAVIVTYPFLFRSL